MYADFRAACAAADEAAIAPLPLGSMARLVVLSAVIAAASALRSHPLVSVAATFPRFETVGKSRNG